MRVKMRRGITYAMDVKQSEEMINDSEEECRSVHNDVKHVCFIRVMESVNECGHGDERGEYVYTYVVVCVNLMRRGATQHFIFFLLLVHHRISFFLFLHFSLLFFCDSLSHTLSFLSFI